MFFLVFSILKLLSTTEKNKKVQQRWKLGDANFNAAAISIEVDRRSHTTERLYSLATEKMFLISLKRKYAGTGVAELTSNMVVMHACIPRCILLQRVTELNFYV